MRKALSHVGNVLLILLATFGVALVVLRLAGIQFLAVRTGSMGKAYPVGSVVVVCECDASRIETDDVITYRLDEETYVTHRVIAINEGRRYFITQGDANNASERVAFSKIVGKVVYCVPKAGYLLLWLGRAGKWVLVGVAAVLALVGILMRKRRNHAEET